MERTGPTATTGWLEWVARQGKARQRDSRRLPSLEPQPLIASTKTPFAWLLLFRGYFHWDCLGGTKPHREYKSKGKKTFPTSPNNNFKEKITIKKQSKSPSMTKKLWKLFYFYSLSQDLLNLLDLMEMGRVFFIIIIIKKGGENIFSGGIQKEKNYYLIRTLDIKEKSACFIREELTAVRRNPRSVCLIFSLFLFLKTFPPEIDYKSEFPPEVGVPID